MILAEDIDLGERIYGRGYRFKPRMRRLYPRIRVADLDLLETLASTLNISALRFRYSRRRTCYCFMCYGFVKSGILFMSGAIVRLVGLSVAASSEISVSSMRASCVGFPTWTCNDRYSASVRTPPHTCSKRRALKTVMEAMRFLHFLHMEFSKERTGHTPDSDTSSVSDSDFSFA